MVLTKFLGVFNTLGAMEMQGLCFLSLKVEGIVVSIADVLFELGGGGAIAPKAVSIHLMD